MNSYGDSKKVAISTKTRSVSTQTLSISDSSPPEWFQKYLSETAPKKLSQIVKASIKPSSDSKIGKNDENNGGVRKENKSTWTFPDQRSVWNAKSFDIESSMNDFRRRCLQYQLHVNEIKSNKRNHRLPKKPH